VVTIQPAMIGMASIAGLPDFNVSVASIHGIYLLFIQLN
jgi:hypothetical protein